MTKQSFQAGAVGAAAGGVLLRSRVAPHRSCPRKLAYQARPDRAVREENYSWWATFGLKFNYLGCE